MTRERVHLEPYQTPLLEARSFKPTFEAITVSYDTKASAIVVLVNEDCQDVCRHPARVYIHLPSRPGLHAYPRGHRALQQAYKRILPAP
jgi:hypothetical protein